MSISFDIVQVPIVRPWFSLEFIRSNGWKFAENAPYSSLSDGKTPPSGVMPYYTSTAIFVKDVVIKSESFSKQFSDVQFKWSSEFEGGWGPFRASAKHSGNESDSKLHTFIKDGSVHINGIQLIGFLCSSLPESPNPNTDIQSWV
ncbi:MAG: hypothetical protein ACI9CD_001056 [Candidatus Deianiraeaceae bacterium]|jgi:hypothetical protein